MLFIILNKGLIMIYELEQSLKITYNFLSLNFATKKHTCERTFNVLFTN